MKKWIHPRDEETITSSQIEQDDFDARWDAKFGEPNTEVFVGDDFDKFMKEVIAFE